MKYLMPVMFFLFCVLGCEDDEVVEKEYTLEGNLYKNCEKEPFSNMILNFYYIKQGGLIRREKIDFHLSTSTDSNGYYRIKHKAKGDYLEVLNDKSELVFRYGYNRQKLFENPTHYTELYPSTMLKHPVKIKVDRPFSDQDTIFMGASANFDIVFTLNGPFVNNQINQTNLLNFQILNIGIAPFSQNITANATFFWAIGTEQYKKISANAAPFSPPYLIYNVTQRICDGDTVVVDLRGL